MPRPNILFIMDDQHRFDYLGCAGADFVRTPNLDRIAKGGIRFEHCYTNAPICAPCRVALATGLQAHRFGGVGNNVFLPFSRPTYYQRLRDTGYRVGCVGKLDLAKPLGDNSDGARPLTYSWGFTHPHEVEGKMHAGMGRSGGKPFGPYTAYLQEKNQLDPFTDDYSKRSKASWALSAWDSVLSSEDFADSYIGRRTAQWIDAVPDDYPWHMFVSFVGPHDPFDPPAEYGQRYRDAPMPAAVADDLKGKPRHLHNRQVNASAEQIAQCRRQYCAATELIDDQVGLILQALERRGMLDNTYILFASDHGEMLGDHGAFTKGLPYDPSMRVPLLASGPGIAPGQTSDAMVELIDLNATICALAGLPPQERIDARSFAPVLRGECTTHRDEILSSLGHFRCVRTRDWKLVDNINDIPELYDMRNDPDELHNLAEENPQQRRAMHQRLNQRWLEGQWDI